ncbi:MAG: hypothetical protein FJ086_05070, partial [Deltaproteobacteria bacterium]|nr:hypothetical protein [Deltaproteobacteria bacterium]
MKTFVWVAALGLFPLAASAAGEKGETSQVIPLQTREVIERLKMMRAQLLLDQEYNRLLEAQVERAELESKLAGLKGNGAVAEMRGSQTASDTPVAAPARRVAPPPRLGSAADQLVVKALTTAPFKEAIVTYKGRVYTVRPGDKLGDIEIRDITDAGVVTAGNGRSAVIVGQ